MIPHPFEKWELAAFLSDDFMRPDDRSEDPPPGRNGEDDYPDEESDDE